MSSSVSSRAYFSRLRWSCVLDHGQRRRRVAIAATTCLAVGSSTKRPPADTTGPHRHRGEGPIAVHFENLSLTESPRSLTDSPTSLALALILSVAPSALSSLSSVMSPMVSLARPPRSSALFWNLSATPMARLLHRLLCRLHCRMLQCCRLFRASHSTPLRLRTGGVETDMQGLLSSAPASRSPGPLRPPTGRRARWRRGTGGPSAGCPSRSSPWHRTRFPPPAWARARTAAPV